MEVSFFVPMSGEFVNSLKMRPQFLHLNLWWLFLKPNLVMFCVHPHLGQKRPFENFASMRFELEFCSC